MRNLSKFISSIEDEGMFGLAQSAIAQSTNIVVSVASVAIGTAMHVVSDVSSGAARLVPHNNNNDNNNDMYMCNEDEDNEYHDVRKWTNNSRDEDVVYYYDAITTTPYRSHDNQQHHHNQHRDNSPFGILSIASTIADIMLGAISPLLVKQRSNGTTDQQFLRMRGIEGTRITSSTSRQRFLHAEMNNSFDEHSDRSGQLFFDANDESCCRSNSHAESVYYDATSSTRSLSTTDSFVSSDDADESSVECCHPGVEEDLLFIPQHNNIPRHVVLAQDERTTFTPSIVIPKPTFYLDLSDVLSEDEEEDVIAFTNEECIMYKDNSNFYIVNESLEYQESFHRVLDILVDRSFCIAQMNDEEVVADGELYWKPDDRTKKYLERRRRNNITSEEWTHVLETEVLKWTGSVRNSSCPMLKTRGRIDMSPLELKELLLDCTRNHLYNQNSISKTNLHCFADNSNKIGEETKIVQNVMKIPIVGGQIQTVSLTHARRIENGSGYILISQSVGDDANTKSANPYYSISILRSVPNNENQTELTNITRIASIPIPKFLMHKVGLMGAMDFFKNLRSLCKDV